MHDSRLAHGSFMTDFLTTVLVTDERIFVKKIFSFSYYSRTAFSDY